MKVSKLGIGLITLAVAVVSSLATYTVAPYAKGVEHTPSSMATSHEQISAKEVIRLHNEYRASKGLPPLTENAMLDASAAAKAADMDEKEYWAHDSPTGKTPWDFIDEAGYVYSKAGENLGQNFSTSKAMVDAWILSPGHEANMSGDFTDIGVAVLNGVNYQGNLLNNIVVVHFGKP